jgi:hypothetical protein
MPVSTALASDAPPLLAIPELHATRTWSPIAGQT